MNDKKKVLFVGSFKDKAADGSIGGQMFACRTLVNSKLKDEVDFVLIDTTAESVPAPPPYKRVPHVLKRIYDLTISLLKTRIDTAIIFSSSGLSLKEKGFMGYIASLFKVKVIFAPRSGLIKDEVARSKFSRYLVERIIRRAGPGYLQGTKWKDFYTQFDPGKGDKFRVLLNWIDTEKYKPLYQQNSKKQDAPGPLTIKLLYLGWLEPYKGIADFLTAFHMLLTAGYNIQADVYGAGSLSADINTQVNNLGIADSFRLHGWAHEPAKLKALTETDIFVLPSYAEGIPNALIEAMASGLPCISSDVGGVADLIENGVNGLIFTPGNVDELYHNIIKLYQDKQLRRSMGQKAYEFIQANCSVDNAVTYFEKIL